MSILGLTIDYGPFGFMDYFDKGFICNGSDHGGRYSYENQPKMCKWNLEKFGEAIQYCLPLKTSQELAQKFDAYFKEEYESIMHDKLGLQTKEEGDSKLFEELFEVMHETSADMTNTFRKMNKIIVEEKERGYTNVPVESYIEEVLLQTASLGDLMRKNTPKIPEQHLNKIMHFEQLSPGFLEKMGPQGEQMLEEVHKYMRLQKLKKLSEESKRNENQKE